MTPTPTIPNPHFLQAYLRLDQIVRNKKKGISGLLPISRTSWLDGVRRGIYPKPVKISSRCVAWKAEAVYKLLESL